MNKEYNPNIQLRILFIGILFFLFFTVIVIKAVQLQIFKCDWLSQKAADQYEKTLRSAGTRGTIYDSKHKEMAVSIEVQSIAAYPKQISDPDVVATNLAKILGVNYRTIHNKLSKHRSFTWIKRHVAPQKIKQIKQLKLKGIDFIKEHSRFYPNKTLASQLIGFSGLDGKGLEGIEFYYNNDLSGKSKELTIVKDALGRRFEYEQNDQKEDNTQYKGNNLILTINSAIQYITESALKEAATKFSAKTGIAIVMNSKTGAILSIAHYPLFNPNSFRSFNVKTWRNRAVTDAFEPGSTLKVFTAAAALESGICTPNSIFFCENGKYRIRSNTIHDTHRHDWLSLQQVIKFSSNIGAAKIGQMIGKKNIYNMLVKFGFGEKTGIDCPGETSGNLPNYSQWRDIDSATIAFGHGISVSAVQLITAVSAIANNGMLMKPYLVDSVVSPSGEVKYKFNPKNGKRVVSTQTANQIKTMMQSVVTEGGTGTKAAIDGYTVCGKTGTAQKIDETGKYAKGKYISSFVGFAPMEDPKITVFVVLDEPFPEYYGGIVAGPAFKKIMYETLHYMNIPSESSKKEQE